MNPLFGIPTDQSQSFANLQYCAPSLAFDAVKDPEGPFLCLPNIYDLRSDITTKALEESGWAVVINEQAENFKIQDLERKIFTPARNRLMCEAFPKNAQRDPAGQLGKSIRSYPPEPAQCFTTKLTS